MCSLPYQSHDLHVREVTPHVTRPPVLIEGATQSAAIGGDDVADAIGVLGCVRYPIKAMTCTCAR